MRVTVSPEGKLVADAGTIEKLKALVEADARTFAEPPAPRRDHAVVKVAPPPSDDEVEALLGGLMATVYVEAQRSFQLAREHTAQGRLVEMRDIHIHQGARLCRAFADLIDARRGRREQRIVVQHVYSGGQAVGVVDTEGVAPKSDG